LIVEGSRQVLILPENQFRISKRQLTVRLYLVNGEEVQGAIFLHHSRNEYGLPEEPLDLMNLRSPFIAVVDQSDTVSFYNKSMVLYLTYQEDPDLSAITEANLRKKVVVKLHNGICLTGQVQVLLPQEHARLYDYLNLHDETFMKMAEADGAVSLVNKAFIMVVNQA